MIIKNKSVTLFIRLGALLAVLLLLAACSDTVQQDSTAANSEAGGGDEAASEVETALDFEVMVYQGEDVLGGETIQFSEILDQGQPVVLNFWAGLCPPCRVEMPDFQAVYENRRDDILLVGLDVGTFTGLGTNEDGRALLQELDVTYPAGTTSKSEVVEAYKVISMPSTVFITPEGEIIRRWAGLLNEEKMTELVDELIEASETGQES